LFPLFATGIIDGKFAADVVNTGGSKLGCVLCNLFSKVWKRYLETVGAAEQTYDF
jgi:hypothetical protein